MARSSTHLSVIQNDRDKVDAVPTTSVNEASNSGSKGANGQYLSEFQRQQFRLTADKVAPVVEVAGKQVRG